MLSCEILWVLNTTQTAMCRNSLPEEVQNVHKHVLCFPKNTCQNPADAPSIGKYLAQATCPKISLLVGSGKYSFLNILWFFSGSLYISECSCCSLLWYPTSTATHGCSGLSEHLSSLILAPASRWVVWTVVMLHSPCSVLSFWEFLFLPQKTSANYFSVF